MEQKAIPAQGDQDTGFFQRYQRVMTLDQVETLLSTVRVRGHTSDFGHEKFGLDLPVIKSRIFQSIAEIEIINGVRCGLSIAFIVCVDRITIIKVIK